MLATLCWMTSILLVSYSSPVPNGACSDGSGVYILESYMPCSMLVTPGDPRNAIYGLYNARAALCATGNHDCCRTCRQLLTDDATTREPAAPTEAKQNVACEDVGSSIQLADGGYDCSYLLDPDLPNGRILGIYTHRVAICTTGVHQCCRACQTVLAEDTAAIATKTHTAQATVLTKAITSAQPSSSTSKPETSTRTPREATSHQPAVITSKTDTATKSPSTKPPTESTSKAYVSESLPAYTVQVNNANNEDIDSGLSPIKPYDVAIDTDRKGVADLVTMEKRVQDKVDELQHEVDVLFSSFKRFQK